MGTWGTGVFDDDLAADLREAYRELVGEGRSGSEATRILVERWGRDLADADMAPVFWLSLAATQWQLGRLEDSVKAKALEMMDTGADLERWRADPKAAKERRGVLGKLRRRLESSPPTPKKVRPTYKSTCDWEVGEIIAYRLRSGRLILVRVLGRHIDQGGVYPTCEVLDWTGETLPEPEVLKSLPVKRSAVERTEAELRQLGITQTSLQMLSRLGGSSLTWDDLRCPQPQFMLGRTSETELPADRMLRLRIKVKPHRTPGISRVVLWRDFDAYLEEVFGLT